MDKPTGFARWRAEVRRPGFVIEAVATVLSLMLAVWVCTELMKSSQARPGAPLDDPILRVVGPIQLRWPIFAVLWTSILLWFYTAGQDPPRLLMGLQAAVLLVVFRAIAIYLVPLEPPPAIIPLADPIARSIQSGVPVTKDLFFSGHTSGMFLMFLTVASKRLKAFFLAGTIFIGIGVVLQHVHYSGDVYAAPFFAYGSWRLIVLLHGYSNRHVLSGNAAENGPARTDAD